MTGSKSIRQAMVVGANRGIGLALCQHLLERHTVDSLLAVHRPAASVEKLTELRQRFGDRVTPWTLDSDCPESFDELENYLRQDCLPVDLTIHAAGLLHDGDSQPEKTVFQCESEFLRRQFEVNSILPLMVARTVLKTQKRSKRFMFAALSAMVGSIGDNRLGGWYGYRASKSALNQFIRTLSIECRIKFPNASVLAIHPGTTDTDMSAPFQQNVRPEKLYAPHLTAARILSVLTESDHGQSGQFLNWNGQTIPW
jgi:NAD(P)-dependent dehydrogenase (short-subunit alcohol dehydrogenase family)